jgi:hypothetical protein
MSVQTGSYGSITDALSFGQVFNFMITKYNICTYLSTLYSTIDNPFLVVKFCIEFFAKGRSQTPLFHNSQNSIFVTFLNAPLEINRNFDVHDFSLRSV